ncbi:hypothetical protein Z043_121624, partial [Scleropages formosus]
EDMNSLAGRSVLSLCRQAAGGPAVKTLMNQGQRAVRATGLAPASLCHSGAGQQRAINVKKRGYDVTRNPHLNKFLGCLLSPADERMMLSRSTAPIEGMSRKSWKLEWQQDFEEGGRTERLRSQQFLSATACWQREELTGRRSCAGNVDLSSTELLERQQYARV